MRDSNYFQPTEIMFGAGRLSEIGEVVKRFGNCCFLVTVPIFDAIKPSVDKTIEPLKNVGI